MSRKHENLKVFALSDELAVATYRATRAFPVAERFGLQSQLRRAAVSVPTNIVEGCTRGSLRDYLHFLTIALGSASEAGYLLNLSRRLDYLGESDLEEQYKGLVRALQALIDSLSQRK
jgi:four helix bundle protein